MNETKSKNVNKSKNQTWMEFILQTWFSNPNLIFTNLSPFHDKSTFHNRSFKSIIFKDSLETTMFGSRSRKSRNTELFIATSLNLSWFGPIPFVDIFWCDWVFWLRISNRVFAQRVHLLTVPKFRFGIFNGGFRITEKVNNYYQQQFLKMWSRSLLEWSEFRAGEWKSPGGKIIITKAVICRNSSEIRQYFLRFKFKTIHAWCDTGCPNKL